MCLCFNADSDIKVKLAFMLFTIINYYFSSITRHRFLRICEVFVGKDFSRFFDVLRARDDRITCAVQRRQWPYVNRLARHNPLEVSKKNLSGNVEFLSGNTKCLSRHK